MNEKPKTRFERDGMATVVLDVEETAAYLAVSEITLRRMVRDGEILHTRVRKALRFRVEDLDRYLEKNTRQGIEVSASKGE